MAKSAVLDPWLFAFLLIGLVAIGFAWLRYRFAQTSRDVTRAVMLVLFGAVFTLWGLYRIYTAKTSHDYLETQFEAGNYSTISGVVVDFQPEIMGIYHSHRGRPERFTIGGRTFTYSSSDDEAGFHKGRAQNGPIREGMHLEVDYLGDRILRIRELPQSGTVTACA